MSNERKFAAQDAAVADAQARVAAAADALAEVQRLVGEKAQARAEIDAELNTSLVPTELAAKVSARALLEGEERALEGVLRSRSAALAAARTELGEAERLRARAEFDDAVVGLRAGADALLESLRNAIREFVVNSSVFVDEDRERVRQLGRTASTSGSMPLPTLLAGEVGRGAGLNDALEFVKGVLVAEMHRIDLTRKEALRAPTAVCNLSVQELEQLRAADRQAKVTVSKPRLASVTQTRALVGNE